ncbi:MAG: hypothetical protein QM733_14095 [Ilumatobacteraceae bacterium]
MFHVATAMPTKAELIAAWVPRQSWAPMNDELIELVGSFHIDDPEGRVGMEVHLAEAGGTLLQVPLTYRDAPLAGADEALIGEMQHSALGTRWVYDGLRDPRLVMMLAAVTMTGQGEALGAAVHEGRWYIGPSKVRISGGGWGLQPAPVDGFDLVRDEGTGSVLRNDRFDLTVYRRPTPGARPAIGLTATWPGLLAPVVLAEIAVRAS